MTTILRLDITLRFVVAFSCLVSLQSIAQCVVQPTGADLPTKIFDPLNPKPGFVQTLKNPLLPANTSPIKFLTFGDSVVWGNGLKEPDKFVTLAGQQLANKTRRVVQIIAFAHSGARLIPSVPDPDFANPGKTDPDSNLHILNGQPLGDLTSHSTTTAEQIDCAIKAGYTDAEVIIVDGCINNVGATNIALPNLPFLTNLTPAEVAASATRYCSQMKPILDKLTSNFQNATIIVINYYRVVSCKSGIHRIFPNCPKDPTDETATVQPKEDDLDKLADKKNDIRQEAGAPTESKEDSRESIKGWPAKSDAFLTASERCLMWSVAAVDGYTKADPETDANGIVTACPASDTLPRVAPVSTSKARVYLATVPDDLRFAYSASQTHLWLMPYPLVVFGFVKRKDEMYRTRETWCDAFYKKGGVNHNGSTQTSELLGCNISAMAHPNRDGAWAYAQSIIGIPHVPKKKPSPSYPPPPPIFDTAWAIEQTP